jgi:CheY-like chemotaxis protein
VEDAHAAPFADGLDFATHDLEHLEKFAAPAHHAGQVGFFGLMQRALAAPGWGALEAGFDAHLAKPVEISALSRILDERANERLSS